MRITLHRGLRAYGTPVNAVIEQGRVRRGLSRTPHMHAFNKLLIIEQSKTRSCA